MKRFLLNLPGFIVSFSLEVIESVLLKLPVDVIRFQSVAIELLF